MMKHNEAARRFELEEQGHVAFADYRVDGTTLHILYVQAPPALRGMGAASRLMRSIVDYAQNEKLTINPICGYARVWLEKKQ
jgi:predicted GNAT family acetyltransferase